MDRIKEMLRQLAELNDEQITELENSVISEFDSVESQDLTAESVAALEQLAGAVDSIRTEKSRRVAEREALSSKAAEAVARVRGTDAASGIGDTTEAAAKKDPLIAESPMDQDAGGGNAGGGVDPNLPPLPTDTNPLPPENTGPPSGEEPMPGLPFEGTPPTPDEEARKRRRMQDDIAGQPAAASTSAPRAGQLSNDEGGGGEGGELTGDTGSAAAETPGGGDTGAGSGTGLSPAESVTTPGMVGESPAAIVESGKEGEPKSQPDATAEIQQRAPGRDGEDSGDQTPLSQTIGENAEKNDETQTSETRAEDGSENSARQNTNTSQEAAVTAAANGPGSQLVIEPPADRRPTPKATATVAITAGADIPGVSAGAKLEGAMEVAESFVKRLHGLRRVNGGDGEQHIVASMGFEYPDERVLDHDNAEQNFTKIQDVVGPQALVASGGWCAPLEVRYDLWDFGYSTARPVKDSLPSFNADRGGIRYQTPPQLGAYEAGISVWTAENDINPTAPAVKPCVTVDCGTEMAAVVDAVTLCLQFGNLMTRAYPELVRRHNDMALVQHARFAEAYIMEQMRLGSVAVTAGRQLGAVRDFLRQVDRAVAAFRHRYRLEAVNTMRVIAPLWMRDLLRADIMMQMPGDGLDNTIGITDAVIDRWLGARNIQITWHIDGPGWGAQGPGALLDFPPTVEWFLYPEGTWLFLDGGTLDLGIIRDSGLVGTNDYKMFVETFEGLAKMGPDSLRITSDLSACGNAAALVDTCVAAATP